MTWIDVKIKALNINECENVVLEMSHCVTLVRRANNPLRQKKKIILGQRNVRYKKANLMQYGN